MRLSTYDKSLGRQHFLENINIDRVVKMAAEIARYVVVITGEFCNDESLKTK